MNELRFKSKVKTEIAFIVRLDSQITKQRVLDKSKSK